MAQLKSDKKVQHGAQYGKDANEDAPGELDGGVFFGVQYIDEHDGGQHVNAADKVGDVLNQSVKLGKEQQKLEGQRHDNHHGSPKNNLKNAPLAFRQHIAA